MGGITLDPCADLMQTTVRPENFYAQGGLTQPWWGKIYCNPPGTNSSKSVKEWWTKAMQHLPELKALTFCLFNMEQAFSLRPSMFELPGYLVMPDKRVAFWRDGEPVKAPRNRAWFWTTCEPAATPIPSRVVPTGGDCNWRVGE